jgi:HEPN domain-containing protein
MTPRNLKTKTVEKGDYRIYLKKAKDFYDTMLDAQKAGKWTDVGLNAMHCAISCCDAMLVFHLGLRSIGEDHMQVASLLTRLPQKDTSNEITALKRIVAKKNVIAYENRDFRQTEATDILKLTEKFYKWVLSNLPT